MHVLGGSAVDLSHMQLIWGPSDINNERSSSMSKQDNKRNP
jgi:hypothetical protein